MNPYVHKAYGCVASVGRPVHAPAGTLPRASRRASTDRIAAALEAGETRRK